MKSAAKEVWNEKAENQKSLRAIISILKEQEFMDGGAKIAVANRAPSLLVDMLPINVKPHYARFWESWRRRISNHSRLTRNLGANGPRRPHLHPMLM